MAEKNKPKYKTGSYIDGIAASEHIDSSGERIEIKGIDISSLTVDGVLNFEHKSDQASQIVGKITYAKKILERKDCENDRQRYFWDKIKTPYLYIIGELFDAVGHQGAKDVLAMLRYDESNKGREDKDIKKLINFSIEGQKLEKRGSIIKKCIARKVSITITPCNKMCEAEELQDTKDMEKSDKFAITQDLMQMQKGEKVSSCQLMKAEYTPKRTFTPDTAPDKIKAGDRIKYDKPRAKTGAEIYGKPPKFSAEGRKISEGKPPEPNKPTPASKPSPHTDRPSAKDDGQKGLSLVPKPPKHANTMRPYHMIKSNMRKAIIASTAVGAPSTRVNDLSKESIKGKVEATCEPKMDLMKPCKSKKLKSKMKKAKVDEKLNPGLRQVARDQRRMESTSAGYSTKDAGKRSAFKEKMGKSEGEIALKFIEDTYPTMEKSQKIALAKTITLLWKSKNG